MYNLKQILKEIEPSPQEVKNVKKATLEFNKKLKKDLLKEKANLVLGGSIAKGTWLKGNHDIDIFIQFIDDKDVSNRLEKILKKNFDKVERVHGSRDYFHVKFLEFIFEVVPVLKIKTIHDAHNITDASVFHIKWVNKNTTSKLKNDIRLAKQFCKAAGVYGAETHISGFSGYVVEILVVYFKGFEKFAIGLAKLEEDSVIDVNKHKRNLDKNKLSPIILIDPVQGDRNAAAALSKEKFEKLKAVCKEFLKKKDNLFFVIQRKNINQIKKKYQIVLEIEPLEGKRDVVGTKVLKVFEFLKEKLNSERFIFTEGDWEFSEDKSYIWFNVKNKEIEKEYTHYGPPVSAIEFADNFREKYKGMNIFISENRLAVVLKREHYEYKDFVLNLLKDKYVTDRVKSIKFF